MLKRRLVLSFLVLGVALAMGCSRQNTSEEVGESTVEATESAVEQTPATTGKGKNEGRATDELIHRLEKRVTFTEEQRSAIKSIAATYNLENLPRDQRKAAVQKIMTEIRAEVLTPEQIEIMKQTNG